MNDEILEELSERITETGIKLYPGDSRINPTITLIDVMKNQLAIMAALRVLISNKE